MIDIPKPRLRLIQGDPALLTQEEMRDGWHFSEEWDGMLIHKTSPEADACGCVVCKGTCDCDACKPKEA